ncbi:MAG: polyprenyl synthetase family protein, partial [Lachnospiraceae bacterium]|nr:polyprenyl synthetase family protein [Lachnospiraceae bacterium]
EAMNYSVMAGGKRLRPLFMMEAYKMFAKDNKNVDALERFMAAIEMIHSYSLVHDDLPDMDNDEFRRGRKTTHVVYGPAMAILAGDGLLGYAYEVASYGFNDNNDYIGVANALKVLTRKPGLYGMLGGQAVDVENDKNNKPLDKDMLDFVYRLKTSALIEASLCIGAILGGAKEEEVKELEKAGCLIGLAFQIQDDILDVTGDATVIGKPVGSDDKNNKTTYVTLYGVEKAKKYVEEMSLEAMNIIRKYNNEFLLELVKELITREK